TQDVVSETVEEITQAFEEITDSFAEIAEEIEEIKTDLAIYDALIDFFKTESWSFQTLPQQAALRLAFKGKNGQWDCYAKAREAHQQVVFYSISPITVAKAKRNAIAEFLTRANHGMILGNFELDYSDGEIRYKTSIDVEGDKLTIALIRNLVYTNVLTMDQYLPGILAVLEQGTIPEQAIRLVEQSEILLSTE
ncbi:MAG: YbjN domain-containing protein, partial [Cyanobacteria bacterium J06626_18]